MPAHDSKIALVVIDIALGPGKSAALKLHHGESIPTVVSNFIAQHSLPVQVHDTLVSTLQAHERTALDRLQSTRPAAAGAGTAPRQPPTAPQPAITQEPPVVPSTASSDCPSLSGSNESPATGDAPAMPTHRSSSPAVREVAAPVAPPQAAQATQPSAASDDEAAEYLLLQRSVASAARRSVGSVAGSAAGATPRGGGPAHRALPGAPRPSTPAGAVAPVFNRLAADVGRREARLKQLQEAAAAKKEQEEAEIIAAAARRHANNAPTPRGRTGTPRFAEPTAAFRRARRAHARELKQRGLPRTGSVGSSDSEEAQRIAQAGIPPREVRRKRKGDNTPARTPRQVCDALWQNAQVRAASKARRQESAPRWRCAACSANNEAVRLWCGQPLKWGQRLEHSAGVGTAYFGPDVAPQRQAELCAPQSDVDGDAGASGQQQQQPGAGDGASPDASSNPYGFPAALLADMRTPVHASERRDEAELAKLLQEHPGENVGQHAKYAQQRPAARLDAAQEHVDLTAASRSAGLPYDEQTRKLRHGWIRVCGSPRPELFKPIVHAAPTSGRSEDIRARAAARAAEKREQQAARKAAKRAELEAECSFEPKISERSKAMAIARRQAEAEAAANPPEQPRAESKQRAANPKHIESLYQEAQTRAQRRDERESWGAQHDWRTGQALFQPQLVHPAGSVPTAVRPQRDSEPAQDTAAGPPAPPSDPLHRLAAGVSHSGTAAALRKTRHAPRLDASGKQGAGSSPEDSGEAAGGEDMVAASAASSKLLLRKAQQWLSQAFMVLCRTAVLDASSLALLEQMVEKVEAAWAEDPDRGQQLQSQSRAVLAYALGFVDTAPDAPEACAELERVKPVDASTCPDTCSLERMWVGALDAALAGVVTMAANKLRDEEHTTMDMQQFAEAVAAALLQGAQPSPEPAQRENIRSNRWHGLTTAQLESVGTEIARLRTKRRAEARAEMYLAMQAAQQRAAMQPVRASKPTSAKPGSTPAMPAHERLLAHGQQYEMAGQARRHAAAAAAAAAAPFKPALNANKAARGKALAAAGAARASSAGKAGAQAATQAEQRPTSTRPSSRAAPGTANVFFVSTPPASSPTGAAGSQHDAGRMTSTSSRSVSREGSPRATARPSAIDALRQLDI